MEKLQTELTNQSANLCLNLTDNNHQSKFTKLLKAQIANGTNIEQIYNELQSIGVPNNCRLVHEQALAVATELYGGEDPRLIYLMAHFA